MFINDNKMEIEEECEIEIRAKELEKLESIKN